ncbi:MAG: phosphatase PAP2 family protein [Clostridia bacterium]|nr:phosphatase PAP2 family protein [Clostridia bacterium]
MQALDFWLLDSIRAWVSCALFDILMPWISMLGEAGVVWILSGGLLLCTKKYRKEGFYLLLSLLAGLLICNLTLKPLVARARPCWLNPAAELIVSVPHDFSFPSGHATSSFAAAASIYYANRKFGIVAFIVATVMAFSRLYLYVHFPSDVLAGAAIGFACGYFVPRWAEKWYQRFVLKK